MIESTLNANYSVDIFSISSKFHMWMYHRIKNLNKQISEAYLCLVYGKPFITKLFEGPSYLLQRRNILVGVILVDNYCAKMWIQQICILYSFRLIFGFRDSLKWRLQQISEHWTKEVKQKWRVRKHLKLY